MGEIARGLSPGAAYHFPLLEQLEKDLIDDKREVTGLHFLRKPSRKMIGYGHI